MRPEYKFTIRNTYIKTHADSTEIATDDASNVEWKYAYKGFKKNIRTHLKLEQRGRCAFCRCVISTGTSYSNLEHLISKKDYPQFNTLPENLVYCCWRCNSSKVKKNTIAAPNANKAAQLFPTTSAGFVIVNPYIDDYEDYIEFYDDVIIIAKNPSVKGINTIEFYNLSRPELAEDRAREFQLEQKNITAQLLLRLTDPASTPHVLEQINNIIAEMPSWTI